MYRFSQTSSAHLTECHPALIKLARDGIVRAWEIGLPDIGISDGGRTMVDQKHMVKVGASWTLNSRHRFAWPLTNAGRKNPHYKKPVSHAFDYFIVINRKARWEFALYQTMWDQVWKPLAVDLNIAINWGGNWKSKDGPHLQLSWAAYPSRYADDTMPANWLRSA